MGLGQSVNVPAMRRGASLMLSNKPDSAGNVLAHYYAKDISHVNWKAMKEAGVTHVVLDKDNTITLPYSRTVYLPLLASVEEIQAVFGPDNVVVFSNSAGSSDDVGFREAQSLSRALGVHVLKHGTKKPDGGDMLAKHFGLGPPSQGGLETTVMVGDRHLTDVVFGNLNGMLTLKTELLSTENDNKVASIMRRYEAKYVAKMIANDGVAPQHPLRSLDALTKTMSTSPTDTPSS